jgi:membrane-associated phospholipid phosphatase
MTRFVTWNGRAPGCTVGDVRVVLGLALAALLPCAAWAEAAPASALPQTAPAVPAKVPARALPTAGEMVLDAGRVLAWPLQLQLADTILLGGAALSTIGLLQADTRLYRQVHRLKWTLHKKSLFDYTLVAGDGLVDLAVLGAFAFAGDRGRRTALTGLEALISVAATSALMKHFFRVPRPQADPGVKSYFRAFGDDAFPSGHTMAAFATASVISAEYPDAAPLAYGVAALVGLSVMKRGWHWPSDVLAGGALGLSIGRVSVRVNRSRISVALTPGGLGIQTEL